MVQKYVAVSYVHCLSYGLVSRLLCSAADRRQHTEGTGGEDESKREEEEDEGEEERTTREETGTETGRG